MSSEKCQYCDFISNDINDCKCFSKTHIDDMEIHLTSYSNEETIFTFDSPQQFQQPQSEKKNILLEMETILVDMIDSNTAKNHPIKSKKIKELQYLLNEIYSAKEFYEEKLSMYHAHYITKLIAWKVFYDMDIFEILEKDLITIIEILNKKSIEFYGKVSDVDHNIKDFTIYTVNKFIEAFIPFAEMTGISIKQNIMRSERNLKQHIAETLLYYKQAYHRHTINVLK